MIGDAELAESLPLVRAERSWSFLDVLSVKSGLAVATWAFLFGGATAELLGFWDGVAAMLLGETIGVVILLAAVVIPSRKWGTEHFVHQRSVYGPLGVMALVFVILVAMVCTWTSILATMIGKASVEIVRTIGVTIPGGEERFTLAVSLVMLAVAWLILTRGSRGLRLMNRAAAPALIVLSLWLLVALLIDVPLATLAAAAPLNPTPDRAMNIMLAVELHIAGGLGWYSLAANLGRYAHTPRALVWSSVIAYVLVFSLACAVGLASALTLASADPVVWMVPLVGPVAGVGLLLLLAIANLSSLVGMVQGDSQTAVQHLGARLQRLGWNKVTLLVIVGAAMIPVLTSDTLYDRFQILVAYLQAWLASTAGIAFADRLLRHDMVDVRALYADGPQQPYHYWRRVNPFAFVALALGCLTYLLLFDPIALTGSTVFLHLSASVPACVVAGGTHALLTRIFVMPAGKGGYRPARTLPH